MRALRGATIGAQLPEARGLPPLTPFRGPGFAIDLVTWLPVLPRGLRKQGPKSVGACAVPWAQEPGASLNPHPPSLGTAPAAAVSIATTGAITAAAAGLGSVSRGMAEKVGFRGWLTASVLGFGVPFTVVRLGLNAPSRGRIVQRVIMAAAHSGVQLSRGRAVTVLILYSGLFVGTAEYGLRRVLGVGM